MPYSKLVQLTFKDCPHQLTLGPLDPPWACFLGILGVSKSYQADRKITHPIGNKSTTPLCWHLATHSITEFILEEGEGKGIYVEYSGPLCQQQPGLPNTAAANVLSTQTKSSTKETLSFSPLLSHTDKTLLGEKQKKPTR